MKILFHLVKIVGGRVANVSTYETREQAQSAAIKELLCWDKAKQFFFFWATCDRLQTVRDVVNLGDSWFYYSEGWQIVTSEIV